MLPYNCCQVALNYVTATLEQTIWLYDVRTVARNGRVDDHLLSPCGSHETELSQFYSCATQSEISTSLARTTSLLLEMVPQSAAIQHDNPTVTVLRVWKRNEFEMNFENLSLLPTKFLSNVTAWVGDFDNIFLLRKSH